jgi:putative OPT family oligopeptide transporter
MEKLKNTPFVPEKTDMREFTLRALLLGVIMAVVLGAANAYLGLKAGMTVAATFPAAVVAMAVLRLMKGTILEENLARTVGSVGEALAAGAIFVLPAFVLAGVWKRFDGWAHYLECTAIMIVGGVLGVLFVTLLRRIMVEDAELPYPESVAAAAIHKAGRRGGTGAVFLFASMVFGALVQLGGALKLFADVWERFILFGKSGVQIVSSAGTLITKVKVGGGALLTTPVPSPAYLGVGYIIGPRLAAMTFAGGLLAWGLFVPLLMFFVGPGLEDLVTAEGAVHTWQGLSYGVWKFMVRPIAVGGMLVSAAYTLYRMRKNLFTGLARSVGDLKKAAHEKAAVSRLDKDISFRTIAPAILIVAVAMGFLYYYFCQSVLGAVVATIVMIITGFFFSAVSGYIVGIIGSSNNPISGLTISTVIVSALLMVVLGVKGIAGIAAVLGVAAVICITAAVAGDMLQDLKVGQILGGTPWKMETGEMIGAVLAALVMFFPLLILHQGDINIGGTGFGGEALPAPQAGLMAMLAKGIVGGQMAWPLVIVGMLFALALICVQVRSPMIVAVGMYLPFGTVATIFVGGVIRAIADWRAKKMGLNDEQKVHMENTGVLIASGLIAGEALMGLLIAALAFRNISIPHLIENPSFVVSIVVMVLIGWALVRFPLKNAKKNGGDI